MEWIEGSAQFLTGDESQLRRLQVGRVACGAWAGEWGGQGVRWWWCSGGRQSKAAAVAGAVSWCGAGPAYRPHTTDFRFNSMHHWAPLGYAPNNRRHRTDFRCRRRRHPQWTRACRPPRVQKAKPFSVAGTAALGDRSGRRRRCSPKLWGGEAAPPSPTPSLLPRSAPLLNLPPPPCPPTLPARSPYPPHAALRRTSILKAADGTWPPITPISSHFDHVSTQSR